MKIALFSIGTQGDVRPFVALGLGLQSAGHEVCIASGETCRELVEQHGLTFAPLTADFLDIMARDPKALQKGLNPVSLLRTARRELTAMASDWAEQGMAAARGAQLLIGNGMVASLAAALGEVLSIPTVESHLQPITPCGDIPPMMLPPPKRQRMPAINRFLYHSCRQLTWQMLGPAVAKVRRDLGLDSLPWYGPFYHRRPDHRVLYGFSPILVPPSPQWPASVKVAGNWFLEEGTDYQPSTELADFLAAGPAPVYVGFGSMLGEGIAEFTGHIVSALRQSGQRGILATGWGGLAADIDSDDDILVIPGAPHDWLFPRVSMAVHHGGVGTTAAALRAGIPSVVVPFFGDQPFWGWRLNQLGVAPPTLARKKLDARQLAEAMTWCQRPDVVDRATLLGAELRCEDGIAKAIATLEQWGLLKAERALVEEGEPERQLEGA